MAPQRPYRVHSLNKHIEDTKKGLSAEAQYNRRPVSRPPAAIKKESGVIDSNIFGNSHGDDGDDDESGTSSDSSSDEESGADFLKKLGVTGAKASTAPKRREKDAEIADSDVERNASAKKTAAIKQESPMNKAEPPSSGSPDESSSEAESEESESKVNTNGVSAKDTTTSTSDDSSSGSEDESDSEEEPSMKKEQPKAETNKPAVKATMNGTSNATASTSSSEDESEQESSEDEQPAEPTKTARKQTEAAAESSSSESDEDNENNEKADESMHISDRENSAQLAAPNFIAPDFVLRKGSEAANGQDVARICNEANLQGKQVWYFTVPSHIPISVVQDLEIPMDRAQLGDRIFSHDGQDYGVSFDNMTPKSSFQILIPSANDSSYQPARQHIDQTMHIKRITCLGGTNPSSIGPTPKNAPRPQPKGLKARYQPFGVSSPMGKVGIDASESEEEDVEMAEAPDSSSVTQKSSNNKNKSKKDKEKRNVEPASPQPTSSAAVSQAPNAAGKGKRKHTTPEDDATAATEQLRREENRLAGTKIKKQKTGRTGSPDLGSELPVTAKKQTPIAPPTIPQSSYSFSSLGSSAPIASTPTPMTTVPVTSTRAKKSSRKAKIELATLSSSQPALPTGKKQTPVPVPRQTAVPLPNIPIALWPRESLAPIPAPGAALAPTQKKGKKGKKGKDEGVAAIASSQQSPPASAQSEEKKRSTPAIKSKNLG